jgi:hypothetical protein
MAIVILIIFFALLVWALLSIVIWSIRNGISPTPTSTKAMPALLKNLPEEIHGTVYELGSGWGSLAFALAKRYPHHQVVAIESSPVPFWISKAMALFLQPPNLVLIRKNFFEIPLRDAGLVVCYLYPGAMEALKPKLEAELPSGAWVISNTFAVPGWTYEKKAETEDLYHDSIYCYLIKTKRNST